MNKTCEICDKSFECTVDEQCWCMTYPPIYLNDTYTDCICDTCLHNVIKESEKID